MQAFRNPNNTIDDFNWIVKQFKTGKPRQSPSAHVYYEKSDDALSFGLSSTSKPISEDGSQGKKQGDPCTIDGEEGVIGQDGKCRIRGGGFSVDISQPRIDIGDTGLVGADYSNIMTEGGGFSESQLEDIQGGIDSAKKFITDCGEKLQKAFENKGIEFNIDRLSAILNNLSAKPEGTKEEDGSFTIFNAAKTTFANTDTGKLGAKTSKEGDFAKTAAFVVSNNYPIFLNKSFFDTQTSDRTLRMGWPESRGIVMIHEVIHLMYIHDNHKVKNKTVIRNSTALTNMILNACKPGRTANDLTTQGV